MKILFVCRANRDRSKTAEHHFAKIHPEYEFRSCGICKTYCDNWGGTHLKRKHLEWADRVICMSQSHINYIHKRYAKDYDDKLENAQVEDLHNYMAPELIKILEEKIKIQL